MLALQSFYCFPVSTGEEGEAFGHMRSRFCDEMSPKCFAPTNRHHRFRASIIPQPLQHLWGKGILAPLQGIPPALSLLFFCFRLLENAGI